MMHSNRKRLPGSRLWLAILAIGMLPCACVPCGCGKATVYSGAWFSPDGQQIAFSGVSLTYLGPDRLQPLLYWNWAPPLPYVERIYWCETDSPDRVRSAAVARWTMWSTPEVRPELDPLRFSPDSKRIAFRTKKGKLIVLETETGSWNYITRPDEICRSFAWIGSDALGYETWVAGGGGVWDSGAIWVSHLGPGGSEKRRRKAFSPSTPFDGSTDMTYWSPNGRFVFLSSVDRGSCLLDVRKGKFVALENCPVELRWISQIVWKSDSSEVVVIREDRYSSDNAYDLVLCVDPRAGHVLWQDTRSPTRHPHHSSDLLPTADDRYLLAPMMSLGGGDVICPRTGQRLFLRKKVMKTLGITDVNWRLGRLHPLPVHGWVATACYRVGPDKRLQVHAIDYAGMEFKCIAKADVWCVSPDGSRVAEVDKRGKVTVREIHLKPK